MAASILTGQPRADQYFEVDGTMEIIPESVHLRSAGNPNARVPVIGSTVPDSTGEVTTIHAGNLEMSVRRSLNLVGSPQS
ncbi:hypothetical protein NicSoilB4_15870 [Arthrobacter sp. NicSoilB4]|uniref:hypothetical protein n=1 Tax=Arthrobacter sp. NicSoilB4 TaxID=2830997 RepID=UPI001CC4FF23|nr:hypothetical protein [Arthrobacter sp. NicSoilB4]BCW66824.1 hypothetical protein NicSoilB4_15870 [Arthrobacter sp. NicSoilB4]